LAGWIWGFDPYKFPSLFSPEPIQFGGVRASPNSLGVIAIAFAVMLALYVFFEKTREGTAMRAASQNAEAARLMGVDVRRVSTIAWGLAGAIGMISGMLIAPLVFLDYEMMVSVLLKAFAGAILGGFNSLPGAVIGGLAIGVIEVLFSAYVSTAFKDSFAFLIIVAVLMFRPTGLFTRSGTKKV
ncbi:MAG TPA: branched-chain amino acid ABC transporter permease, partial [Burkholderiaceae bacterium]|nr:branched-chain amino acid ABC transporter permease [Burkholderiaceae bacterium]